MKCGWKRNRARKDDSKICSLEKYNRMMHVLTVWFPERDPYLYSKVTKSNILHAFISGLLKQKS